MGRKQMKRECHWCHEHIEPYQPGTSLSEEFGVCHTSCLYTFGYGEPVPEVLK